MSFQPTYKNVLVRKEDGITTVTLNRPEKRNAMSPELEEEMLDCILNLEADDETLVLVLTGAGKAWCAGMDLDLFFRELEGNPANAAKHVRAEWAGHQWKWHRLYNFPKPTIAMVNGYCFGGAFTQLVACDFAIAADSAVFGLSEVNWGVIPGGLVSKAMNIAVNYRDALYYSITGKPFKGPEAARMGLINESVPDERLHDEVMNLARHLAAMNPETLRATKQAVKATRDMTVDQAHEYLIAKNGQLAFRDPEGGYKQGISKFIDAKAYRPGYEPYPREKAEGA
ncbi:p-hydroxycinnamoyl CoA hydratase/lyase [Aquibium microcysteis]|uniref:p-hydroxycinnamoyl CoA hydratase/lyase n=1 Tax=Aquibium microcysteis TaxID=675281 RepID=UPI00165D10C2|nr:p-hydroxycinnamoyl CoA hydratase/lyase [Aquibium microcysteis]